MAISEELLIIIIVCALGVALVLTCVMAVYFCYCRRRTLNQQRQQHQTQQRHQTHPHNNHQVLPRNDVSTGGGGKMRLDKLPTGADTKRMEEGYTFTDREPHMNGGTTPQAEEDTYNFIMGPSADLSERQEGGVENDGFTKDSQGGAYLRGGVDPADVAEVYMEDDVLQEAARARRKQQLEVRRKAASKNNSKKRTEAQKNLQEVRKKTGEASQGRDRDRDSSKHGHRSSEKNRHART